MAKNITVKKWHNGAGVDLIIEPQYGTNHHIRLDLADVDVLLGLLQDYKARPSPYQRQPMGVFRD